MAARGFGWLFRAAGAAGAGLYAWGSNGSGRLGLGDTTNRSSPVQVGALTTWAHVSAGNPSSAGILSNGTLYAWGSNGFGQLGQSNTTNYSSPVQIGALTNWDVVSMNENHCIALKTDGTLWSWGGAALGRLGQGNLTSRSSPVQIGALTSWTKISTTGYVTSTNHAIRSGGTLWAWGYGGQVDAPYAEPPAATVNKTNYSSPVQVSSAITWSEVASGSYHALALTSGGALYAWGNNEQGQCGRTDLNNPTYYIPEATYGECAGGGVNYGFGQRYLSSFSAIGAFQFPNVYDSTFTICGEGVVGDTVTQYEFLANTYLWGFSSPVQVGSLTTWSKIAAGSTNSMAIKTDGTLWAWGLNNGGQLGTGNTTSRSSPVQVGALTTWAAVDCGSVHTLAVRTDGTLWAWGDNSSGQLGQGNTTARSSPVQVGTATNWTSTLNTFSAGGDSSLAIRS